MVGAVSVGIVTLLAVEFSNLAHDFPQLVRYRLQVDGSLLAQVEGPGEPGPRVVDFPFQRVECP